MIIEHTAILVLNPHLQRHPYRFVTLEFLQRIGELHFTLSMSVLIADEVAFSINLATWAVIFLIV